MLNLNQYMFYNENINKFNNNLEIKNKKTCNKLVNNKLVNNNLIDNLKFFKSNNKDQLFWCFFIIIHNYNDYLLNINNLFKIEKDFKLNSISLIRNNKLDLKYNKIKINNIENELVNEYKISLDTIKTYAIIYNLNIIILNKCTYSHFSYGKKFIHIIEKINDYYILHLNKYDTNDTYIKNLFNQKLLIDYKKPLRAISYYKLVDLQEIANKLNVNIKNGNKNIKKNILYQEILNKIQN